MLAELNLDWLAGMAPDLVFFAVVSMVGMFVYGFAGFASGLLCIPILGLRLETETFIPAFQVCVFLINLRLVYSARGHVQWPHVGWLLAGAAAAAPIGVYLLKVMPTSVITFVVGLLAISLGIMYLSGVKVPIGAGRPTRLVLGGCSGLLAAMCSAGGPPVVIYALARGWPKDRFRSSLMAYFMCLGVFVLLMYIGVGMYTKEALSLAASGLVPMSLAAVAGTWLKTRTNEKRFRSVVLWLLILVGVIGVSKDIFL